MARPAIVTQMLFEAGLLRARLLVNAGDARARAACGFGQARMVGLRAAHQRIDQRHRCGAKIECGDGGAVAGLDDCGKLRRADAQLLLAIEVEVGFFHADPIVECSRSSIEQRFRV